MHPDLQEAIDEERAALGERARVVRQKVQGARSSLYRNAGFQLMGASTVSVITALLSLPSPSLSALLTRLTVSTVAGAGAGAGLGAVLADLKGVPLQGADLALWHLQK